MCYKPPALRGAFAKAARGPVTVPPDLLEMLQAALVRRIGELLGLARRAGQAVAGFEKVAGMAADRPAPGWWCRRRMAAPRSGDAFFPAPAGRWRCMQPLTAAALGVVFGRDHAVHVVVAPGALADRIGIECMRLAGLAPEPAAHDKVADDRIEPAEIRQRGVRDA